MAADQYPWSIDAYRYCAQSLMEILMEEQGFFARPSFPDIHWGDCVVPVTVSCAMEAAEAVVRDQHDWMMLSIRLHRNLYRILYPVSNLPDPEPMLKTMYQRAREAITQPKNWQVITDSARYYDATPVLPSRKLDQYVKRCLKSVPLKVSWLEQ
jgi:hypothetical protein